MVIDEKHCKIADSIIEILVREECTVADATEILTCVAGEIRNSTTVRVEEKLVERFKDEFSL